MSEIIPSKFVSSRTIFDDQEHILPLLPLKNVVILPKSIIPIIVGRDIYSRRRSCAQGESTRIFDCSERRNHRKSDHNRFIYLWHGGHDLARSCAHA